MISDGFVRRGMFLLQELFIVDHIKLPMYFTLSDRTLCGMSINHYAAQFIWLVELFELCMKIQFPYLVHVYSTTS